MQDLITVPCALSQGIDFHTMALPGVLAITLPGHPWLLVYLDSLGHQFTQTAQSISLPRQPWLSVYMDNLGYQFTYTALGISLHRQPWLSVYLDSLGYQFTQTALGIIYLDSIGYQFTQTALAFNLHGQPWLSVYLRQPWLSVYLHSLGYQFTQTALVISLPGQPWLSVYIDSLGQQFTWTTQYGCNDALFPKAIRMAIFDMYYDTFYRKLQLFLEVHAGRHGRCHVFFLYEVAYVLTEIINI